jgi:hypothetical protein
MYQPTYRNQGLSESEMYRLLLAGKITQRDYDMHSYNSGRISSGRMLVALGGII